MREQSGAASGQIRAVLRMLQLSEMQIHTEDIKKRESVFNVSLPLPRAGLHSLPLPAPCGGGEPRPLSTVRGCGGIKGCLPTRGGPTMARLHLVGSDPQCRSVAIREEPRVEQGSGEELNRKQPRRSICLPGRAAVLCCWQIIEFPFFGNQTDILFK